MSGFPLYLYYYYEIVRCLLLILTVKEYAALKVLTVGEEFYHLPELTVWKGLCSSPSAFVLFPFVSAVFS